MQPEALRALHFLEAITARPCHPAGPSEIGHPGDREGPVDEKVPRLEDTGTGPFDLNVPFEAEEAVTNHRETPSAVRCFGRRRLPIGQTPRYGRSRWKSKSGQDLLTATQFKLAREALGLVPDTLIISSIAIQRRHCDARHSGWRARSRVRRRVSASLPPRMELGAGPKSSLPFSNLKKRFCSVPT